MSELPRRIVSRLRRFIGNRRRSKRVRIRLSFTLSLEDLRISSNGYRRLPSLDGYTLDVSATGLALVVPAIRIGEHYLAGDERKLHIKLELPAGPIEMRVATVRYETMEDEAGYVIGARIIEMSESDRASFNKYVAKLMTHQPGA